MRSLLMCGWFFCLVWTTSTGCRRKPPPRMITIKCTQDYRSTSARRKNDPYPYKGWGSRKHDLKNAIYIKSCKVFRVSPKLEVPIRLEAPVGAKVTLGTQSFTFAKEGQKQRYQERLIKLRLLSYAKQKSLWEGGLMIPLRVEYADGETRKSSAFRLKVLSKHDLTSVSMIKSAPWKQQGGTFTKRVGFRSLPGTTLQFDGKTLTLGEKPTFYVVEGLFKRMQLMPLKKLGVLPTLDVPMRIQTPTGETKKKETFLTIEKPLLKALKAMFGGSPSAILFSKKKTKRSPKVALVVWREKGLSSVKWVVTPEKHAKRPWRDLSGFGQVEEYVGRVKRCGPYRSGKGRRYHQVKLMYAKVKVFDRKGKQRGERTFRTTSCPIILGSNGAKKHGVRFRKGWQRWLLSRLPK